jgi:hypothetical protein
VRYHHVTVTGNSKGEQRGSWDLIDAFLSFFVLSFSIQRCRHAHGDSGDSFEKIKHYEKLKKNGEQGLGDIKCRKFQVLTVASMKFRVFWDETSVSFNVTTARYIPEDSKLQEEVRKFTNKSR